MSIMTFSSSHLLPLVLPSPGTLSSRPDSPPLPPLPHAAVQLFLRHPVLDETERHAQLRLHIPIPRLVVKKEHLLVGYVRGLVDLGEMCRFRARVDLEVVKVVERADGARVGASRVVGEGGDDVQRFEHVAREVRGGGA